jgi:predicted SprT family Zn-dependent metalloprotease
VKTEVSIEKFKKRLSRHVSNMQVELVINENRSTMLNVLTRKRDFAKISLHKMFLDAPEDVISAIAHYVRGTRRSGPKDGLIRGFIQSNLERMDYSHLLDESKFVTVGRYYDLIAIYDQLNERYFKNKLDLKITWYGTWGRKNRTRVTFGQYFDHLKLIKIHRVLDDPFFPEHFVVFVIYHEMLHHVVPGFVDERGLYRVHGSDFKDLEKKFHDYEKATAWEKEHRHLFFKGGRC